MQRIYIQIFLLIFIPLCLLLGGLVYYSYQQEAEKEKVLELNRDLHDIELQDSIISRELSELSPDVLFLADLFYDYPMEDNLKQISEKLRSFAAHRGFYDQIRFLDHAGMEQLRINYNNGTPYITPATELQNRSEGYYFKQSISLDKGQVFHSPFDLNMEEGDIEQPIKSVLRIATPLYNRKGEKLGVIILNYRGSRLFTNMEQSHRHNGRQLMLLNSKGYWLLAQDKTINREFMSADRQHLTFAQQYPDIWEKLSGTESGQLISPAGTFTWQSVLPWRYSHSPSLPDVEHQPELEAEQAWKIVMLQDADLIARQLAPVKRAYLTIVTFLAICIAVVSALLTCLIMKQKTEINNRNLLQEAQLFTNKLLKSALTTKSLQEEMAEALEMVLSISWLSILAKGSIFLLDEESNELVMIAQQGLAKPLLSKCARVPIGKCLCGRAAERKDIIFTSCLDHQHEITFEGITEHGHICVPIMKDEKLMGVLNLYVEHGHIYNPFYDETLSTITNALAGIIERKQMDDHLQRANDLIKLNRDELAYERNIVEDTLSRIRSTEEFDAQGLRYLMAPAESTAGDIILSARRPGGIRHIMLGDFTGHGLPSALAGPAVADTFYAMTKRDLPALKILSEINAKLVDKLPPNLYLAACFIEFNPAMNRLSLWNASLPEPVLFRSGTPVERYKSTLLALGIIDDLPLAEAEQVIDLSPGDLLYAFTDGVIEASDADGVMFGEERFEALLSSIITENKTLETVVEVVNDYQLGEEQADDITMLEIHI